MIDPQYWASMAPFNTNVGDLRPMPNGQSVTPGYTLRQGVPDQQAQASSQQNPYDWTQAFIEQERSRRQESDRQFQLQLQQLEQQRQRDAVTKGQVEAQAAYNRGLLQLSQAKLAEDKRQFDTTTQEAIRQFNIKQQELSRQFDITTAEGKRQFDLASAESKRQFDATFGQRAQQFQQDLDFRKSQLTEGARQYDLSRGDQLAQFAEQMGLDKAKLAETARQYDLTRADERERFLANLAENRRQFDVTASGYINGAPTLERERWQNQALMDWTDRAIQLASNPADWVKYKQMTMGVSGNAANIPGLAWTQGGQQGNTAFAGNPEPNSLGNVLGAMGVNQQPSAPAPAAPQPAAPAPSAPAPTPAPAAQAPAGPTALTPQEQARFQQIMDRRQQLQAAGEGDVSSEDQGELARYQAIMSGQGGLSPGELSRYQQIITRSAQLRAAGEGDVSPEDQAELARYQARLSQAAAGAPAPAPQRPMYGPAPGGAQNPGLALSAAPAAPAVGAPPSQGGQPGAAPTAQPVTNWAQQAAGMLPTNAQLRASMSPAEQSIWDTADQFSRNPQGAAAGWYEQLDPMTRELVRGASQAQGNDWTTVMSRYNRSRWGGGGSARAA